MLNKRFRDANRMNTNPDEKSSGLRHAATIKMEATQARKRKQEESKHELLLYEYFLWLRPVLGLIKGNDERKFSKCSCGEALKVVLPYMINP